MTISGVEAWITSATEDKDVRKALLLAASLRRVYTAKKLVVLTSSSVFEKSSDELKNIFDQVVPLIPGKVNGLEAEDWAKAEAFSMTVFSKCTYLSPSTMVLKNCDHIFAKYGNLASLKNENGLDSSVLVFSPNEWWGSALRSIMKTSGEIISSNLGTSGFNKLLTLWVRNNTPDWEILDGEYNVMLDLKGGRPMSMNAKMSIANFGDCHPSSFAQNGFLNMQDEFGPVEKYLVEVSRRLYAEGVEPKLNPSQLSTQSQVYKTEPIAIVGMSFRLPGGNNVDELWELLINGREAIRPLPEDRWTREHTHKPCENRKVEGGFLNIPIDEFDAKFFGISGKEAEGLDPQIRLLHEVTWEALEDAMIDPISLSNTQTGIFVGSWLKDYGDMIMDTTDFDTFRGYMGTSIAATAARLSHFYETTGRSIGTETGCSAAIVGVDMACKSLRSHESNLALACGVNLLLKPFDRNTFSFVVSPEGRCKTFDESANGFGRAEGCAVLVLKRLSDALNNEDKIWGLIRGSGITQEGASKSFGTPTVHCESLAMRMALKDADVDPIDVSYVEAHGTGTQVGDPMEINAIAQAYSKGRSEPLVIGSVKTNVGHTESVSGITGIIKVLLSMKNERIPQHRNLTKLNPAINLESIPAIIPMEALPWPKRIEKPRVAGVSSFGISGADGHVIIQEAPIARLVQVLENDAKPRPLHIMKISAKSPESFQNLLSTYENIFASKEAQDGFADLAYSANIGRATFNHRAVIIGKDFKEARAAIQNKSFNHAEVLSSGSQLCFLFTGQGSQYPNMGATLYATSPIFRDEFNKCDRILTKRYGINMREVLWGQSSNEKELSRTLYSQTSIFCIEYCLLRLWESWGVKPDYVMGHSLGEFAAAVAAGVLDFEDGLMLVAERSKLIDALPQGKMLVIRADKETVNKNIEKFRQVNPTFWVDYAALNSPDQTVVAGDSGMIEEFAKFCGEKSLKTIVLAATHAFHSRHMEPMLEAYHRVAQTVKPNHVGEDTPKYISGMDGKLTDLKLIDAEYWVRHTREPVRFIGACKVVQSEGCSLFLEVGPHPVLSALTMMNAVDGSVSCLPSIRKKDDEWATMLDTLAKLYLSEWKGQVDWKNFDRYYNRTRVSLPFYPFNRKSIWRNMEGCLPNVHPLLGRPVPTECDHIIFEKKLTLKNTSYVRDHVIGNTVIYPGAAFMEMCIAGGHAGLQASTTPIERMKPIRPIILKSLKIMSPLALYDSSICSLQTSTKLNVDEDDEISYSIGVQRYVPSTSDGLGEWTTHATASYFPVPATSEKDKSLPRHIDIQATQAMWQKSDCRNFYEKLPETGLRFGPKFQSLGNCWKGDEGMLIRVEIPEEDNDCYLVHPLVGDAMIQASMLWNNKDNKAKMKLQVPVGVDELMWYQTSTSNRLYLYCRTNEGGKTECLLVDGEGARLARMTGVDFVETTVKLVEGMIQQHKTAMPKLWREVWRSSPGALQSSYDFTSSLAKPFLQFDDNHEKIFAELNDPGMEERTFYEDLCKLVRLYFLNAMYEIGWKPTHGATFALEELVKLLPQPKEHFQRYIQFFLRELSETGMLVEDEYAGRRYRFAGGPPTLNEIQKGMTELITKDEDRARPEYKLIVEAGRNMPKVWLGEVDPLQILFPESPSKPNAGQFYISLKDLIGPVMNKVNDALFKDVLDQCYNNAASASSPPVLRVLEVGSGTGSFSESNLECLASWGKPFEFYYTDISASFFPAAEAKFEKYSKQIVFKKFDMEEDPLAQGLCPGYFDLILASEVMHVAKDISQTLSNLKCLLKPGGMFQIVETTLPDLVITQIFGILDGYWGFQDLTFRPDHITLTPDKWEHALKGIGCDSVVCKLAYNNVHGIITARLSQNAPQIKPKESSDHSWLIFSNDSNNDIAESLKKKLIGVNRNVRVAMRPSLITEETMKEYMKLQLQPVTSGKEKMEGVVYLWGLNDDPVNNRDQSQVSLPLTNLVQSMMECRTPPRLYVITQGTAIGDGFDVTNPTSGTLHGIIKSLSNESSELPVRSLDLEPNVPLVNQVDKMFQEFWGSDKGSRSIAFRDDERLCMKLISAKVNNNEPLALPSGCDRYQLQLPETRMLSDLEFGPLDHQTLEDNEIEVHVKAMALNFRDVLTVLKPIAAFEEFNTVGLEFAGEVVKVGSNVTLRKVGDRVIGMNMNRNLSLPSHIKIEEQMVVPLPISYTYTEGVTLPAVFSTVVLCLIKIAKMKRGETVLIHTASGGVGLCAIQFAKHVGANIIATAGSNRKQNYLRNLGIKHVFHSRTTQFGQQILDATNGMGVDIVLNSITGAGFKEASLAALAKNGRFIEMSKLNVWTPEEVNEMRPDVFYQLVDLTQLDKSESQELLMELRDYLSTGTILPIPYERFDAVNIRGALNYLQKAKHIGKIVCVMPDVKVENSKLVTTTPQFNEYSTYLVTGGLGGIGFEVVKWMLSNGAKHIAIASRSPPKPNIANQIESWNKSGKHVEAFAIDIGDYAQCQHLFRELTSSEKGFPQLRGVMHAAGVLSDATIENQTWSKFRHTYNPKVDGTWNLHDLTKDMMLEHFVLFSSIAASIGSPGQSNHAASNHFEDALAAYRRSNGLPATSVNWGNWGEVGVATELDFPGVRPIGTAQGILALETFLKTQESHICVANFESFALAVKLFPSLKNYVDDKRLFGETKATVLINSDDFWHHMDSSESQQGKTAMFKDLIKSILKNILKMEPDEVIDDRSDFQTLGVDSLMMLEMKNGLQSILGSRITLTANHVKDCSNTTALANRLFDVLKGEGHFTKPTLPAFDELQELIKVDSILPEHIRPSEGQPMCEMSKIETVLLTGATGVLGPYMLRELCNRPSIKRIICMVRKIGKLTPAERVLERLRAINLYDQIDTAKLRYIQGDVTEDRFGLSEREYNDLAQNVDAVINSAVRADHTGKYFKAPNESTQDIRSVNVKGTERILEFAVKGKLKHVYHGASILSVITMEDDDEEDDDCYDLENNIDLEFATEEWQAVDAFDQLPFNLGYPLSKHVAEQLCQQAAERGIPCKTFRLPIIGGDSKTGRCDYRSNHFILRWLTYMKLECMPNLPLPMMVIPVDECARISLEVFFHPESPLDVYNIVHPGKSVDQVMTKIAKEYGLNIRVVSLREFTDNLLQVGDESPLAPFMKLYRDDEEEMFDLLEKNDAIQGILKNAENNLSFYRSKKLAQFVEGYHNLEPTESVMRRDIRYLKETGVLQKFGIRC